MRRSVIFFTLLVLALPFIGLQCTKTVTVRPVTLKIWRVFDSQDTFRDIIAKYQANHPYAKIEYRELRYDEYEQELLNAWAEDRGPDIFSIHNTWVGKYLSKISPLPASTTVQYQYLTGVIKKEVITENRTTASITANQIRDRYVDVVGNDVIRTVANKEAIIGLPLAVDTLVLYYNKDILNRSGIATVPGDWKEFLDAVSKITKVDDQGNIIVAAASLGTATNIPRFSDILSVLMMQNGARMTDANGYPTFQSVPPGSQNKAYVPGIAALQFYADFANPGKQSYTWNKDMPDAFEAFTQGRTAFFFGYAYHLPMLKARAPQLRYGIAPIPQADAQNNRVNFANYWIETVAQKSAHKDQAWSFIQFASSAAGVESYLTSAQKPTALRSLIEKQKGDAVLGPFAEQLLTAKSWYRGNDAGAAEAALADMVEGTLAAQNSTDRNALSTLIGRALTIIGQTIQR